MIAFLEGVLKYSSPGVAVVSCNGVGYEVMITLTDTDKLPPIGSEITLYTMLSVSENAGISLYGFLSKDDLDMFKMLITVNGIGPKGAQTILSSIDTDSLRFAVLSEDAKTIAKAQGVGKKTAERIILDLKDRITLEDAFEKKLENTKTEAASSDMNMGTVKEDAVMALVALGYSRTESMQAVQKVQINELSTVDSVLSASLKYLL
ncbi:MAG: Holliday junction branch migration protein RuvA [Lachnospiraceae bacterium]